MDILFLGTAASVPSRERVTAAIAVRRESEIILFDCGESTQRQLMISPFSFMKIVGIFITHMHGDHVFGLPGLLQTMSLSGRKTLLTVRGPPGFSAGLNKMLEVCEGEIGYPLDIRDLESGEVTSFKGYSVSCFDTDHGIPSFGYIMEEDVRRGRFDKKKAMELGLKPSDYSKLQNGEAVGNIEPSMIIGPSRPGLKLVYTGDTHPCDSVLKAAKGADLLIHESTYASGELRLAIEHRHSTAVQAANTAKDSGCRHLILTHISNRYDSRALLESEAKEIFRNSIVADDLNMYSLTDGHLKSV